MPSKRILPAKKIEGDITLPGDKSISHRAVMISSLAEGTSTAGNFLLADDCLATIEAFRKMGVSIELRNGYLIVNGVGLNGLERPTSGLNMGNSGTSMRLLLGILAGQNFETTLSGDASLSRRPMKRVTVPLRRMGAIIKGREDGNFAPLTIRGGTLHGIDYNCPIASAQVKSSLLFAGLYAEGITSVTEPFQSRDHTERMLLKYGAAINIKGKKVSIGKSERLSATDFSIPGDISSASFFIVASLLADNSDLRIRKVGLNKTRTGIIDILQRMGAKIEIDNISQEWEPIGDIRVCSSRLKATTIEKSEIPRAIDELPVLMVAAARAKGCTVIRGAEELRVKETDRIASMSSNLKMMGVSMKYEGGEIYIEGTDHLQSADSLQSFGDHRTAMATVIAGLCAGGESTIDNIECINTSFPHFFQTLESIVVR